MNLSPAQARAALLQVNLARLRAGRPIGLRDGALLALVASGLSATEIARLRASDITMDRGRVLVTFERRDAKPSITLRIDLGSHVLTWLTETRLWGADEPVFTSTQGRPLTRFAVSKLLDRYSSPSSTRPAHRRGRPRTAINPGRTG